MALKKWQGYRSELASEQYDAIIIGSGISGLTCAALLAQEGKKVLLLEKHFKVGGWTHTFRRNNYEWDVGIHYIGEVHKPWSPIRRLFDRISDGELKWHKMDDNYDRIIFPDKHYNFICPKTRFIKELSDYFPDEKQAIQDYIQLIDQSVKTGVSYFGNKALPNLISSLSYPFMTRKFMSFAGRTTYDVISGLTKNEKLMGVLTGQWGDHGLPPRQSSFAMHAMVARHYLDGGNYPIGSARRIAETITDVIEKQGGKVAVNAGVDEICVKNGSAESVILENGDELSAPIIISGSGILNTYGRFLRNHPHSKKFKERLKKVQQTESFICLFIGLNKSAQDLGIKNTNLWIYPGYDHDENVSNYQSDQEAEFPVVYVSFPSAKDPVYQEKYPNNATMEAITLAHWSWWDKWKNGAWKKRGDEYEAEKENLSQRILNKVFKHVPKAKDALDYYELSTPLTVKSLANYPLGEMYGINHTPKRFKQRWLKPKTEIKGLYITGQDMFTVGVSSALLSGLVTVSSILNKNMFKTL